MLTNSNNFTSNSINCNTHHNNSNNQQQQHHHHHTLFSRSLKRSISFNSGNYSL